VDVLWQELSTGLHDAKQLTHVVIRMLAAALLGAVIGLQRQRTGKPAGLRTHMFVCLGAALFVISCAGAGMSSDGLSRVIQGIVTGIGFLGAGSILKLGVEHDIKGLTTAAGVWMTAAIGVSAGLGSVGLALMATALTLVVFWLERFEHKGKQERDEKKDDSQQQ